MVIAYNILKYQSNFGMINPSFLQFNIWKQKPPKTENGWDRLRLSNTHLAKIDFLFNI